MLIEKEVEGFQARKQGWWVSGEEDWCLSWEARLVAAWVGSHQVPEHSYRAAHCGSIPFYGRDLAWRAWVVARSMKNGRSLRIVLPPSHTFGCYRAKWGGENCGVLEPTVLTVRRLVRWFGRHRKWEEDTRIMVETEWMELSVFLY